jgi:hypothetical protein
VHILQGGIENGDRSGLKAQRHESGGRHHGLRQNRPILVTKLSFT